MNEVLLSALITLVGLFIVGASQSGYPTGTNGQVIDPELTPALNSSRSRSR